MTTPEDRNPAGENPFEKNNGTFEGGAHEATPEGFQPAEPGFDTPDYEAPRFEEPTYPSASSEIPGRPGEAGAPGSAAPYTGASAGAAGAPTGDGAYPGGAYPSDPYPGAGYPEGGDTTGGGWGQPEEFNKLAPWALGLAILSLTVMVIKPIALLSIPFAVIAVILGIVGVIKGRKIRNGKRRVGMSVAAIIIGLLTAILLAVGTITTYYLFKDVNLQECEQYTDKAQKQECIQQKVEEAVKQKTEGK